MKLLDFAKVHDTEFGQVLVFVDTNDSDLPAVCIAAHLETGEIVKMHIGGWKDTDAGWAQAKKAFDMMDGDAALNFVVKVLPPLL